MSSTWVSAISGRRNVNISSRTVLLTVHVTGSFDSPTVTLEEVNQYHIQQHKMLIYHIHLSNNILSIKIALIVNVLYTLDKDNRQYNKQ